MELSGSFAYPFRYPMWVLRVLVGATLEVVPALLVFPLAVGGVGHGTLRPVQLPFVAATVIIALLCRLVVLGYLRRVALDALAGGGTGLPPWDRFAEDLIEGLKLALIGLGLLLPSVGLIASFAFLFQAIGVPALAWLPVLLLLPPLLLATVFYLPAGFLASIETGDMTTAFDLRRVSGVISRALGPYLLAFLLAFAAEILAQLGFLLLCVGIFATRFLAHVMVVHAFGTAYRVGAAAAPTDPPVSAVP